MLLHADDPPARNLQIVRFLDYALHDGRGLAERLGYVPLPDSAVKAVEALWASRLGVQP
jgi:phosphate transport system substrate-binding protein